MLLTQLYRNHFICLYRTIVIVLLYYLQLFIIHNEDARRDESERKQLCRNKVIGNRRRGLTFCT